MRLLHSSTLEFHEFLNHKNIAYAILSHTWGANEVLFQELDGLNAETTPEAIKQRSGYRKIKACCTQAASDGFDYVWVDTCCIDKRSSAELSEAINSMYKWYQDSAVCYAYLDDVPNDTNLETQETKFRRSRWFRRGWTLQELIAPRSIEFYGDRWISRGQEASLGTRRSLMIEISDITRIPIGVLQGSGVSTYSVAQKMSWAARRQTTREEDRAYSLMGLFEVNIPLLYGEGARAFIRLQEEIMKLSTDETIFAWQIPRSIDFAGNFSGMLATTPDSFASSASIVQAEGPAVGIPQTTPFSVTNMGLRLEARLIKLSDFDPSVERIYTPLNMPGCTLYIAVLNCCFESTKKLIGVFLCCPRKEGPGKREIRTPFIRFGSGPYGGLRFLETLTLLAWEPMAQHYRYEHSVIFAAISEPLKLLMMHGNSSVRAFWSSLMQQSSSSSAQQFEISCSPEYLWLHGHPREFAVVEAWPTDLREIADSPAFLVPVTASYPSAVLQFANEEDSFIVLFIHDCGQSGIEVTLHTPGQALGDYKSHNPPGDGHTGVGSMVKGNDRVSQTLSSGRVVSASLRRQKVGKRFGHGLYINVSTKRTEQLLESNDMTD